MIWESKPAKQIIRETDSSKLARIAKRAMHILKDQTQEFSWQTLNFMNGVKKVVIKIFVTNSEREDF